MTLAEAAAARSLAQNGEPNSTPHFDAFSADIPQEEPPQDVSPQAGAPFTGGPATPTPTRADPVLAFTRLASCVRQTMSLENTIATERAVITDRASERERNRATIAALYATPPKPPATATPQPKPPTAPPTAARQSPTTPIQAARTDDNPFPSILDNISREIGIDLTDPTLASRLPTKQATETPPPSQTAPPTPAQPFPQTRQAHCAEPPNATPRPGAGPDP